MPKVFVGDLNSQDPRKDLRNEFQVYGAIRSIWVAQHLFYGFVKFDYVKDAQDAILGLNVLIIGHYYKNGWRVEPAHSTTYRRCHRRGGGVRGRGGRSQGSSSGDGRCNECGEPGHILRECQWRIGRGVSGIRRRQNPK